MKSRSRPDAVAADVEELHSEAPAAEPEAEVARLLADRAATLHPDVVEDSADEAEDLVEQETIDALLENIAIRRRRG